jgi:transposase
MSEKTKRKYTPAEKVALLRKHLIEKEAISKICEENRLQPKLFYRWQQEFFERGQLVFEPKVSSNNQAKDSKDKDKDVKIKILEEKLVRKNEVVSELMEELIKVKKEVGVL